MLKGDVQLIEGENAGESSAVQNAISPELSHITGLDGHVLAKGPNGVSEKNKPNSDKLKSAKDDDNSSDDGDSEVGVATKPKTKTKKPNLYRVLLLNDDFTPMEFVILVLERFFRKTGDQATQIMLHVHNNGVGECGVFTYEVAETKVTQVMDFARKNQHPLQCILEKQ